MKELKPCPFCGSLEEDFRSHPEPCFLHRMAIQSDTSCMAYCKEDCEASWNTRHTPDGYALVPVVPTEEMIAAAHHEVDQAAIHNYGGPADPMDIWQAMIAAAQESE